MEPTVIMNSAAHATQSYHWLARA